MRVAGSSRKGVFRMKASTARILRFLPAVLVLAVLAAAVPFATGAFAATGTYSTGLAPKAPVAKFTVGTGAPAATTVVQREMATVPTFARKSNTRTARTIGGRSFSSAGGSELAQAQAILNLHIANHPLLKGTTVSFGDARGYQAISYYTTKRIVISPSHTVSLERILNHEIWHIIDYAADGHINWGENVPPSNASQY